MSWRDRYPEEELTCIRCLRAIDKNDLDRLLWCDECRHSARRKATLYGMLAGALIAVVLGLWIWLVVEPTVFVGGWVGAVLAAWWLGAKVARELLFGIMRFRNGKAVEASPPGAGESP